MQLRIVETIAALSPLQWQQLATGDNPFLNPAFLRALEESGVVGKETGWQPCHFVLEGDQGVIAFMPTYLKYHSYGEYVFDWAWADAYEQQGLNYYPKLVSAIPFTPSEGARILLHPNYTLEQVLPYLVDGVQQLAAQHHLSSWHLLFPNPQSYQQGLQCGLLGRISCQYHWHNDKNWQDFDQFLESFSAKKRKNVRQERRKVASQGVQLRRVLGADISDEQLQHFYQCYQITYRQRGRQGYLNQHFFQLLKDYMPEQLMLVEAISAEGEAIAAALFFYDHERLYGRYWGSKVEIDCLHFETCYYQGIEFCLEQGLGHFDPGTQGEHKIARGFSPHFTYSLHWIAEPLFAKAITHFLNNESAQVEAYAKAITEKTPFKKQIDGENVQSKL